MTSSPAPEALVGSTPLTDVERAVTDEIDRRGDELIELARDLIGFDTTAREHEGSPARDEAALQKYLAARLRAAGAETEVWEPEPHETAGNPLTPDGLSFDGRPQMVARIPGLSGGRSLLLNGHIDVVTVEPRERWTSDPLKAEVRGGNLYGRGSCDMKGGIATMVFAAEVLASQGVRLAGDVVICTVTDEESTGGGAVAAVAHGVRADAGIITESTDFEVKIACRGSLMPTVSVPGRPGHASAVQRHWRDGGAVNAIEKAALISDTLNRLSADWSLRRSEYHPFLPPPKVIPTLVAGGEWMVSYPSSCRLDFHISFPPGPTESGSWGDTFRAEIEEWVARASMADPWLDENRPTVTWAPVVPAYRVSSDEPIVSILHGATAAVGRPARVWGMDGWYDGATFTLGGTPTIAFGGGDGINYAHQVDEHIPVADLIAASKALAVTAMRFCGVS